MSKFVEILKEAKNIHCENEDLCEDCELNFLSYKLIDNKRRNKVSLCSALDKIIIELESMED